MRMHVKSHQRVQATLDRLDNKLKKDNTPPKFCVDCHWHSFTRIERKDHFDYLHWCNCPPLLNRITGEPSKAPVNRNTATLCGQSAIHFKKKAPAEPQRADK